MKLNKRHAVNLIATLALLFLNQNLIQAQVITRVLEDDEKIEKYIPWYFLEKPDSTEAPAIDVEAVLTQDSIDERKLPRFGIKQEVNLDTADGTFYEFGNYHVWKLLLHSSGAKTISFKLTDASLPDGSEMFIYNPETRFVVGPIHSNNFYGGVFNSDVIAGDYAIIEVFLPDNTNQFFSISVKDIIHGIENPELDSGAFGISAACNVNVVCNEGNGWENEISSVCLILFGSGRHCSGALINNECNDFSPFILTANHCTDGEDLEESVYRFNYESATCPVTVEPDSNLWISFSGAQLRATWVGTDFTLLELNEEVINETSFSFSGWNRNENVNTPNVTGIHHPRGDVKKISINNESPISQENNNVSEWFVDDWETGTLEPGSSGSPLYDDNHLIIGQLFRGNDDAFNAPCSGTVDTWYGRFGTSWDGNGTNDSRLSNWLGGVNNPNTVNSLLIPFVSGGDVLCTSSKTYTLENPVPGYAVTWSVSPTSLFGSPTSGTGTTAVLWAANNAAQGSATLTYTLTNADCGNQTFTEEIWVGKPANPVISAPECFTPGYNVSIRAQAQGATNFTWTFPTCPNGVPSGDPDPDCWFNYTGNYQNIFVYVGQQGGSISVWASNECGTSSVNLPIEFCTGGEPGPGPIFRSASNDDSEEVSTKLPAKVVTYPNPVNEILNVELSQDFYPVRESKNIQLLDISGRSVYRKTISGNSLQIDVGDFPSGIFYLKVQYRGDFVFQKVIIL